MAQLAFKHNAVKFLESIQTHLPDINVKRSQSKRNLLLTSHPSAELPAANPRNCCSSSRLSS